MNEMIKTRMKVIPFKWNSLKSINDFKLQFFPSIGYAGWTKLDSHACSAVVI